MAWYGIEYIVNLFEMFLFSEFIIDKRKNYIYSAKFVMTLITASIVMLLLNIVGESYELVAQFTFLFAFFLLFIVHLVLFEENIKKRLISIVQFFVILLLSDIITIVILKLFSNVGIEVIIAQTTDRMVAMVLSKTITLFLIKIFKSIRTQDVYQSKTYVVLMYSGLLIINTMLSMTMLYSFRWMTGKQYSSFYVLLGGAGIIGINFFILFFTNQLLASNKKEQDHFRLTQQNLYYEKYIGDIEQSREAFYKLHHNYKHDIQCISGLTLQNQYDDLKEYISSINERLQEMEFTNYSCPVPLNALLNAKKDYAIKEDVDLELSIFMPSEVEIDDYDLCNIVGNILDNGIEACENLVGQDRKLNLEIYIKKKMLFINGVNLMAASLVYNDDKIETTKSNKQFHGYGLSIIEEIAEKYGGYSTIKTDNQIFDILVGIPFK